MNKELIKNINALEKFVNNVLADTNETEVYKIQLQLRKKYGAKRDKNISIEFVKKSEVLSVVKRISQLVRPEELPHTVLYISTAKICLKKAYKLIAERCIETMANQNYHINPKRILESSLSKANKKKDFLHFDYDFKESDTRRLQLKKLKKFTASKIYSEIVDLLKIYSVIEAHFIITKGGFHLLVKFDPKVKNNALIEKLKNLGADPNKDISLTPIVGTLQAGSVVRLITAIKNGKIL